MDIRERIRRAMAQAVQRGRQPLNAPRRDILPFQQQRQQVGQTLNRGVQQAKSTVGNLRLEQLSPQTMAISNARRQMGAQPFTPTVREQFQNTIATPLRTAMNPSKPLFDRGIGAVQGAFNVTPAGQAWQIGTGGLSGLLKSKRTGAPLTQSIRTGISNPNADIAMEGLGIENPVLAMGLNVALGNPKMAVKGLKGAKGAVAQLKGVNPRAFKMHPDDIAEAKNALDILRKKTTYKVTPDMKAQAETTVRNLLEGYAPGYRNNKNRDVYKVLENLIYKNEGMSMDKLPTPMGFAQADDVKPRVNPTSWEKGKKVPTAQQIDQQMTGGVVSRSNQKKVDQVFKTIKFNVGKKEVNVIKGLQKQLGLESRGIRSFDDMKKVAEEMGANPKQLMQDIKQGRITDSEVIALGNTISTSSQRIAKLTKQLQKTPNDTNIIARLASEEELINQAIKKRIRGGTEAGRAVAAFRVIANRNLEPTYWIDKAKRQLGNKEVSLDVITAINDYIKNKDRLGLASFISKLGESSGLEKAVGLWKASLLTGLRTHEANIVGNTAMAGLETIKDIPATGFDMVRSAITGSPRAKSFSLRAIPDQISGARTGLKNAKEVIKTGIDPADIAKAELYKPLRFGDSKLGKAAQLMTNAVFRTLGAEDKVFYGMAYNRSMGEQLRLAKINGQAVSKPTEDMIKAATQDALYSTFTNENALNNAIKGAKSSGGPQVASAIDMIAPFTRTPTNVAKATFIDYTPVGIVKTVAQKLFNRESVDNKQLAEAFGRSLTGTAALWLGVELAKRGLVSGASSNKETERSQAELEQRPPNSVLINGAWQNVSKISPFGNLILLGAAYHDSGGNLSETAFAGIKGFSENSFLKGVANAGKALNEPDRNAGSFFESAISGYVPTIVSDIARGIDDTRRKPEGLVERIQSRIPGLRESLPSRLNALGEPIPEQGNFISKMANPFNSSKPSDNAIVNEFKRVGYNLNYTGDTINIDGVNTELNRDQAREYQKLAGKYIKQYVSEFTNSSGYKELPIDDQKSMIERTVNFAKDIAREELKTKLNTIGKDYGIGADASGIEFISADGKEIPNISTSKGTTSMSGSTSVGDKIIYRDGTSLKTLDLSPPTKGEGIGAFVNKDWNITKAREVWNANISKEEKDKAIKKLGLEPEDVRYDTLANYNNDIKSQYIISKSPNKDKLYENILTGRVRSIGDNIFASDGVIDDLYDQGYLTAAERKYFKNLDYNKDGTLKKGTGGKGKKPAKVTPPAFKDAPSTKITLQKAKLAPIKLEGRKNTKVRPQSVDNFKRELAEIEKRVKALV